MKKSVLFLALLIFPVIIAFPANRIYVSTAGNDLYEGTKEKPLASLMGARDHVRKLRDRKLISDTDTVYIHVMPGNYLIQEPLKLEPADRGTAQAPVVYTAEPAERPVFYGGFKTDKFEVVSKNLWRVFIPETVQYGGWGLYTDEGSTGIVMENNLVYKCKSAGFHQHYGKENIIRNNIFAYNIQSQLQFSKVEDHKSLSFTNNIVFLNEGALFQSMGKDNWLRANVDIHSNCYWDTRTPDPDFHGINFDGWAIARLSPAAFEKSIQSQQKRSFAGWQKPGRDRNSIVADPLFIDPQNFDFRFRNTRVARKIGFTPFDYSKAGVYGDPEWINLARLDPTLMEEFDTAVAKNTWTGE